MLPQTNLQLYQLLLARGADDVALAQVRSAYDLARRIVAAYFRPSHKPFICHLVGTAGALADWGQSADVVCAGLLHSAYLFGDFGDGLRGADPARRQIVRQCVGPPAEAIVDAYTRCAWPATLDQLDAAIRAGIIDGTLAVIKLADLCDDCSDAGPTFAPAKRLEFGLPECRDARGKILGAAEALAGGAARQQFVAAFASCDAAAIPPVLVTPDRCFHALTAKRRTPLRIKLWRWTNGLTRKRAA